MRFFSWFLFWDLVIQWVSFKFFAAWSFLKKFVLGDGVRVLNTLQSSKRFQRALPKKLGNPAVKLICLIIPATIFFIFYLKKKKTSQPMGSGEISNCGFEFFRFIWFKLSWFKLSWFKCIIPRWRRRQLESGPTRWDQRWHRKLFPLPGGLRRYHLKRQT